MRHLTLCIALGALLPQVSGAQTKYSLRDITSESPSASINNSGTVGGWNFTVSYSWTPSGGFVPLHGLGGQTENVLAGDIDANGKIYGEDFNGRRSSFVWDPVTGTSKPVADFGADAEGYPYFSSAFGCSSNGKSVGYYGGTPSESQQRHGFLAEPDGSWRKLQVTEGPHESLIPTDVNDAGQAVGTEGYADGRPGNKGVFWRADGTPVDMGHAWGLIIHRPLSMNNQGWVTGYMDSETRAAGYVWREAEGYTQIFNPYNPDWSALGLSINESGVVAGLMVSSPGQRAAFVWDRANGTRDLNPLLDPAFSNYRLTEAQGINDSGQIVAQAVLNGNQYRTVVLTPVPEPPAFLLLGAGLLALRRYRPSRQREPRGHQTRNN